MIRWVSVNMATFFFSSFSLCRIQQKTQAAAGADGYSKNKSGWQATLLKITF